MAQISIEVSVTVGDKNVRMTTDVEALHNPVGVASNQLEVLAKAVSAALTANLPTLDDDDDREYDTDIRR